MSGCIIDAKGPFDDVFLNRLERETDYAKRVKRMIEKERITNYGNVKFISGV